MSHAYRLTARNVKMPHRILRHPPAGGSTHAERVSYGWMQAYPAVFYAECVVLTDLGFLTATASATLQTANASGSLVKATADATLETAEASGSLITAQADGILEFTPCQVN